jgi:hypothetical protein
MVSMEHIETFIYENVKQHGDGAKYLSRLTSL